MMGGRRVGGKRMRGRVGTIRELLPSGRTKRATRATLPMLPYMLPSGRTQRATFEATTHTHTQPRTSCFSLLRTKNR